MLLAAARTIPPLSDWLLRIATSLLIIDHHTHTADYSF